MRWLKQSTSVDVPIGPFVDSTDGVTPETALTLTQPDIRLKKNGGAWAQKNAAQTLSHEENGNYEVTLDTTDTNTLGLLRLHVNETGALPVWEDFMVLPANVWDSLFSTDKLQVDVQEIGTDVITAASIAASAIGSAELADNAITAAKINDGAITAAKIATDAIGAAELAADAATEIADAVWAKVLETGWDAAEFMRLFAAALAGKVSGGGTTTVVFRDVNDSKNRITATVDDDGNRSALTLDGS